MHRTAPGVRSDNPRRRSSESWNALKTRPASSHTGTFRPPYAGKKEEPLADP